MRARGLYGEQSNRESWGSGACLQRWLYDHGWTKTRLAQVSGVSLPTIYRMVAGDAVGSVRSWERVSRALGVPIQELMTWGKGEM